MIASNTMESSLPAALQLEPTELDRIVTELRTTVGRGLRRKGAVLGLSGGIDSSVCAGMCARAFGPERVLGLLMPERDCSDDARDLGRMVAEHYGIPVMEEGIGGMLEGADCYGRRDAAIRELVPEYTDQWRMKVVISNLFTGGPYRFHSLVLKSPAGETRQVRLPLDAYQTIVAATNFKQRCRKMLEYYHADRLRYAVVGTPNRLEYDQGFFVKGGDGAADVKPIAHLYKTQVYRLAELLDVPAEIRRRPPTTDTYSLEQSQEEFYFSLPYPQMDLCLLGLNRGAPADEVAQAAGLTREQVERVYADIQAKRKATAYQQAPPVLCGPVPEIRPLSNSTAPRS